MKKDDDGKMLEPIEDMILDVDQDLVNWAMDV
jgi:predicted membrane GTPase involved in stress response